MAPALRDLRPSPLARAGAAFSLHVSAGPAPAQPHFQWPSAQAAQSHAADWLSQWQHATRQEQVQISEDRFEEMLRAEVECLALDTSEDISLENVLGSSSTAKLAHLIHRELSKILARQMLRLERTIPEWRAAPGVLEAHRVLSRSFRELRLADPGDSASFGVLIRNIQAQDTLLAQSSAQIAQHLEEKCLMDRAEVDAWLFSMLNSRIGLEMAMDHYIRLLSSQGGARVGIVHTRCDPGKVCQKAIEAVQAEFFESGLVFKLNVEQPSIDFSFPSDYLYSIVEELLRSGAHATVLKPRQDPRKPPEAVELTVCACPDRLAIKISDRGGGAGCEAPPASGNGTGLPCCKLYTQQLGGSLHFMSSPGVGTDVFVYLPRISVDGVRA